MNTFLPYSDFSLCAHSLDNKRLNKQIVECYQILQGQWSNHPCSKMWKNNIPSLKKYFNFCLREWKEIREKNHKFDYFEVSDFHSDPIWIKNDLVLVSHRVNLLRKDFEWYSQFEWNEQNYLQDCPVGYYWPVGPLGKRGQEHSDGWLKWRNNV